MRRKERVVGDIYVFPVWYILMVVNCRHVSTRWGVRDDFNAMEFSEQTLIHVVELARSNREVRGALVTFSGRMCARKQIKQKTTRTFGFW